MIGADPCELAALLEHVRPLTAKPLIVKLTPNAADVAAVARGGRGGRGERVSLINTLRGMALDPRTGEPWLGGGTGGVSGPAVRAVALAQVRRGASGAVEIPIIGMGGVAAAAGTRSICSARAQTSSRSAPRASAIRGRRAGRRGAAELLAQTARVSQALTRQARARKLPVSGALVLTARETPCKQGLLP